MNPLRVIIILSTVLMCGFSAYSAPKKTNVLSFWDAIELSNEDFTSRLQQTDSLFREFLLQLECVDSYTRKQAIKALIEKTLNNKNAFYTVYDMADQYLAAPESSLKNDECYVAFLDEIMLSNMLGDAEMERAAYRRQMALKNRPGTLAADFSYIDREGNAATLHSLNTDKEIMVFFYDPDCDHCAETISHLRKLSMERGPEVLAIDITGDRDIWENSKANMPIGWKVGFATTPIEDDDIYIFQSMPTIYILDARKTVLIKDASEEDIISRYSLSHESRD